MSGVAPRLRRALALALGLLSLSLSALVPAAAFAATDPEVSAPPPISPPTTSPRPVSLASRSRARRGAGQHRRQPAAAARLRVPLRRADRRLHHLERPARLRHADRSFTILQKKVEHYSNLYDNAPMPYMQRLTWDGVALHAGQIPAIPPRTAASACRAPSPACSTESPSSARRSIVTDEAPAERGERAGAGRHRAGWPPLGTSPLPRRAFGLGRRSMISTLIGFLLLLQAPPGSALERFFVGRTEGSGTVHIIMSGRHGVRDRATGRMQGDTLVLDQVVEEEGKPARRRVWRLTRGRRQCGDRHDQRRARAGHRHGHRQHAAPALPPRRRALGRAVDHAPARRPHRDQPDDLPPLRPQRRDGRNRRVRRID